MIIPIYWAEGRVRHKTREKQVTVRRFGWSDINQEDAQANADARAQEALQRILSGETLPRREHKIPYNGADGLPIREEIIDQRGETVITRNSYGARCLNTPNVFFADLDYESLTPNWEKPGTPCLIVLVQLLALLAGGAMLARGESLAIAVPCLLAGFFLFKLVTTLRGSAHRAKLAKQGGVDEMARSRVREFLAANPAWNFRLYQTPAGLRLLATHQLFDPSDPAVDLAFEQLGTDPMYRSMSLRQKCFRARVSPKPWRIGIDQHMRPRPGTWPVSVDKLPARHAWVTNYESISMGFSSCKFLESLGSGIVSPDVLPVQHWHDELSRAESGLPIA